jgi:hypothetical protein
VFLALSQGSYGFATNYCESCLLSVTLNLKSVRGNGNKIIESNPDIPLHCYVGYEKLLLDPNREEILTTRSREASFGVKTSAKYYRNMDRLRSMKILALAQDIYEGKLVSWGFGRQFDEYYGKVFICYVLSV